MPLPHFTPLAALPPVLTPWLPWASILNFQSFSGLQSSTLNDRVAISFFKQRILFLKPRKITFILLGSALFHCENKEQHNKNNHCALSSYYTSGRKHPLYTGEQQRFTKQFFIPNYYICIKISKKSHIVHCKCPYSHTAYPQIQLTLGVPSYPGWVHDEVLLK